MTTEPTDKSLLRCTLKKSLDVTKKLVLYASYVIVGLAGAFFAIYGAMGIYSIVEWPLTVFMIQAACVAGFALGILVSLPWYVYAGLLVVVGIVGYSFAWCIAREVTQEDRNHTSGLFMDLLGVIGLVGGTVFGAYMGWVTFWIIGAAFGGVFGFIIGLGEGLSLGQNVDTYAHYRKRVRGGV